MSNNQIQSVEEKLTNLYQLQFITSQLDEVLKLQGELPMEVRDMEDEIEGLTKRFEKQENQIKLHEEDVKKFKESISVSNTMIEKYKAQLDNVKNNREFEALSKEIEYQNLEVKLSEKKIREINEKIEKVSLQKEDIAAGVENKKLELEKKKIELEEIIQKTEKKIDSLEKKIQKLNKQVDDRLLKAFEALRKRYGNGLAIVTVTRNACGGCFNAVPPQMQIEISQKKEIIACENCGRVLVADDIATSIDKKERVSDIEDFPRRKMKRTFEFD
ncbi:MAG: zinc ribbon domain-containing protein [Deltaproteobacteria bacterium]